MDKQNKNTIKEKNKVRNMAFVVPLHGVHLKKFDLTFQSLLDSRIANIFWNTQLAY